MMLLSVQKKLLEKDTTNGIVWAVIVANLTSKASYQEHRLHDLLITFFCKQIDK